MDEEEEQQPQGKRKIGLVAMIILVIATVARLLVKFAPAIKGMLHWK